VRWLVELYYGTNGINIPKPFIINRIDTLRIRLDLEQAKLANPDFILVTMHWEKSTSELRTASNRNWLHLSCNMGLMPSSALIRM